ncbi:MAG: HAD family hydrolase [Cyanobacteria bacterium P01_E01_bin.34]
MKPKHKLLICTDLDRTLIPNGAAEESPNARELFQQLVSRPDISLAYVTGRDLDSIQQAIADYSLPAPDYAIADVGASIFTHTDGNWTRIEDWDHKSANYCSKDRWSELDGLFDDIGCLELQEPAKQGLYKLSYYVPGEVNSTTLMVKLKTRLKWEEVQAKVIWSTDEHQKLGLVDILPANADKRLALEFLIDLYKFNRDRTLFAGVSANDTAVMASTIPAVLVANAGAEVKQLAYRRTRESHNLESLYIARGGQLGMNGNYSAGILEGVAYFFPDALS